MGRRDVVVVDGTNKAELGITTTDPQVQADAWRALVHASREMDEPARVAWLRDMRGLLGLDDEPPSDRRPGYCRCGEPVPLRTGPPAVQYAGLCKRCARAKAFPWETRATPAEPQPADEPPGEWIHHPGRMCRKVDPELFFPVSNTTEASATARSLCATCPVREDCLEYATRTGQRDGIWGGTRPFERGIR